MHEYEDEEYEFPLELEDGSVNVSRELLALLAILENNPLMKFDEIVNQVRKYAALLGIDAKSLRKVIREAIKESRKLVVGLRLASIRIASRELM